MAPAPATCPSAAGPAIRSASRSPWWRACSTASRRSSARRAATASRRSTAERGGSVVGTVLLGQAPDGLAPTGRRHLQHDKDKLSCAQVPDGPAPTGLGAAGVYGDGAQGPTIGDVVDVLFVLGNGDGPFRAFVRADKRVPSVPAGLDPDGVSDALSSFAGTGPVGRFTGQPDDGDEAFDAGDFAGSASPPGHGRSAWPLTSVPPLPRRPGPSFPPMRRAVVADTARVGGGAWAA